MTTNTLFFDDIDSLVTQRCDYYVYMLCDPRHDNRPFYVGKGCGNRAKEHLYETEGRTENLFKFNKIKKIKSFGLEVGIVYVETGLTENAAYDIESKLIRQYGRAKIDPDGILTNICEDNRPPKTSGPRSEETKRKIGAAQMGELNHRFGVSWSDEQKEHRRQLAIAKGQKPPVRSGAMSEEQKLAIGAGNKGKKRTPEQSAYLSSIRKGKKRKSPSPETIEKIRASNIRTKAEQKLNKNNNL